MVDTRRRARQWTREHGDDLPEVRDWHWVTGETPDRDKSPSVTARADTSADF
jgi:xylulose-5-phosphate/fructose-6-phosphate phosphoketolase